MKGNEDLRNLASESVRETHWKEEPGETGSQTGEKRHTWEGHVYPLIISWLVAGQATPEMLGGALRPALAFSDLRDRPNSASKSTTQPLL
jgi:hypothetical protein